MVLWRPGARARLGALRLLVGYRHGPRRAGRDRHRSGHWLVEEARSQRAGARYSLLVSIGTPGVETDIWTPVAHQIGVPIESSSKCDSYTRFGSRRIRINRPTIAGSRWITIPPPRHRPSGSVLAPEWISLKAPGSLGFGGGSMVPTATVVAASPPSPPLVPVAWRVGNRLGGCRCPLGDKRAAVAVFDLEATAQLAVLVELHAPGTPHRVVLPSSQAPSQVNEAPAFVGRQFT